MNLAEFFIKYNGKFLDVDGYPLDNPYQCVDLIKVYFKDFLKIPPIAGNAIDYWRDIPGFVRIGKTIFNHPLPGDLIVWDIKPSNPSGHIAICNWYRYFDLGVFEQNNPIGSPCHFGTHGYKNILGWLRPLPLLPKSPLKIARIGVNLPLLDDFNAQMGKYSLNRITALKNDYLTPINVSVGMLDQFAAYDLTDRVNPQEKFIFIFYTPNATSAFFATYYYPKRNCVITTCPGTDARLLTFEFAHQLQTYYNENRGSNPPVEIIDSNFPTDELIFKKYNSVAEYYK